jgi:glycosyltransferase involved in cell wall biosynthesis
MRMAKLARYLPGLGWDVTIFASDEPTPDFPDDHLLAEVPPSVGIVRVRGPLNRLGGPIGGATTSWRTGRGNVVTRALKAAARAVFIPDRWIGWALAVGRTRREALPSASIVLSSGPPHSGHLAGARLAARLKVPHVVDLRDDWADNPLHRSPAPWHGFLDRWIEGRALSKTATVVVVTDEAAAELARRRPELKGRIHVITNGFDSNDMAGLPARAAAPAGRAVEFLYGGSMRTPVILGTFPEVFGTAVDPDGPPPHLTIVGFADPVHRQALQRAIGAERLQFVAPVGHREALQRMAEADVLVVLTGGGGGGAATMTGKLYEALGLRRPIALFGPAGPAPRLVERVGAGFVGLPDDPAAIGRAISSALRAARDPSFTGAPDDVLASLDRRQLAERWAELFATFSSKGPGSGP